MMFNLSLVSKIGLFLAVAYPIWNSFENNTTTLNDKKLLHVHAINIYIYIYIYICITWKLNSPYYEKLS
jgi:hypothetical protein